MKLKLIILLFVLLSTFKINAHTGWSCLYPFKHIFIGIECGLSEDELKSSYNYQIAKLANDFIEEYYTNIDYPIFLNRYFDGGNSNSPCYQISYDTYNMGGALNTDIESYEKMLTESSIFSKIGINIWINSDESPENLLKILKYAIQEEPRLREIHQQLRKKITELGNTTSQEDDLLVIEADKILEVLSKD